MNSRFDLITTKGLLSLAVILMFTAAFVADQARANLPAETRATTEFGEPARSGIILNAEFLRSVDSVPYFVDTILALPGDLEFCFDDLVPGAKDAGPAVSPSL
jgi:hypothetical protein